MTRDELNELNDKFKRLECTQTLLMAMNPKHLSIAGLKPKFIFDHRKNIIGQLKLKFSKTSKAYFNNDDNKNPIEIPTDLYEQLYNTAVKYYSDLLFEIDATDVKFN